MITVHSAKRATGCKVQFTPIVMWVQYVICVSHLYPYEAKIWSLCAKAATAFSMS